MFKIKFYTIIQIFSKFGLVWYDLVWFGLGNLINKSLNQENAKSKCSLKSNFTLLYKFSANLVWFGMIWYGLDWLS